MAIALLCLAIALLACGGSESQTDASATSTDRSSQVEPEHGTVQKPVAVEGKALRIGTFEQEGPFAAISGGVGNEKPHIDPADRPASKQLHIRDLKLGTGPPARLGDEVGIYYAGAVYETGRVRYSGWAPAPPLTFQLGSGAFGRSWEGGIVGMKAGGIRETVAPSRFFGGTGAVDYVIQLIELEPASG